MADQVVQTGSQIYQYAYWELDESGATVYVGQPFTVLANNQKHADIRALKSLSPEQQSKCEAGKAGLHYNLMTFRS